jgi:hypothetical protein
MSHVATLLALFVAFLLSYPTPALSHDTPTNGAKAGLLFGEVRQMGNGAAWSWVQLDSRGNPSSLGITFTETALSGLDEDPSIHTMEYELSLPKQKVRPYTHIVVNWNPRGHVPPGIYDVPHFDFHFYFMAPSERVKITAKGDDIARSDRKLPAQYVPEGYILPKGTQEPRMGSHWIDPGSPEFHNKPFTKTFIYGSYNGEVTFLEPMAAKSFLETKPDVTERIKLPVAYKKHGYYPTGYRIRYDPVRKEYSVSLDGLTYR